MLNQQKVSHNRLNLSLTDIQLNYLRSIAAISGNSIPSLIRTALSNEMNANLEYAKSREDKRYLDAHAFNKDLDVK